MAAGGFRLRRELAVVKIFMTGLDLTAASKTLPFGTIVKVKNLSNNKSVKVKINDRGPYVEGRMIDLSRAAFKKIAPTGAGVIDVEVTILDTSNTFRYKH